MLIVAHAHVFLSFFAHAIITVKTEVNTMAKILNPINDFVFQKIFGTLDNKDLLIGLLNAILQLPPGKLIEDLTVINSAHLDKDNIEDKTGILDVRAEITNGAILNIEVQLKNQYNMERRTLFYWSKLFAEQLKKGHDYAELKKTITINILDFAYLPTDDYHNVYHLREDKNGHLLTDVLEIHFIELPKFSKEIQNIEEVLHRWLMFLGNPNEEGVLDMLGAKDSIIGKASRVLHFLSSDPETVRIAELREKAIWDEVSNINGARAEGLEEGIQKGLERGRQEALQEKLDVARRILAKGLSVEDVADMTGLSVEEVSKLRQ